jgi:UMF1 family MFS transporter
MRMVPRDRAGEFFGFFSVSSKFATVFGPALFAVVSHLTGSSRWSVLSIVLFFVAGMVLLRQVDIERGAMLAHEQERNETGG